ncbi:MAG: hemerythrin domain-containing protein [Acidobacteriota bacterium]|nr:hemerythrin domain-containing protein [Acidobacteriota bacterium]
MREGNHDAAPPIDEMCASIVSRHHAYLHRALPIIQEDLGRLADDDCAAGVLAETRAVVADLVQQLKRHLSKEENLLFPALAALAQAEREGGRRPALPFSTVLHPIRMMETEHARIESAMARLRALTRGFAPEDDATVAWRHCLTQLAQLDADLREHHRTEDEELFPRALELERRLP